MNVLVVNKQEDVISALNIEVIKTLRGVFDADEIISTFTNFYFARMIIDVTALKDYEDVAIYQKLSIGLPIDKVILLIPSSSAAANNYFLSNGDGVKYLLTNPNSYKDVAYLHQVEAPTNNVVPTENGGTVLSGIRILGVKNVTDEAGSSSLIYMMKKELEEKYNLSVLAVEVDKRDFTFFRSKDMISTDKTSIATELLKAKNYNYILVDLNDYDENICDETL